MSYSVVRGKPSASQLYLDGILDDVLHSSVTSAKGREGVSLPQILFYCLRKNPQDVFMVSTLRIIQKYRGIIPDVRVICLSKLDKITGTT